MLTALVPGIAIPVAVAKTTIVSAVAATTATITTGARPVAARFSAFIVLEGFFRCPSFQHRLAR
jgi:hypothetical protein